MARDPQASRVPAADVIGSATPISLRAFSRLLDCSDYAVRKAVASGRLTAASVSRDAKGRPIVHDVEKAREEWAANATKLRRGTQTNSLAKVQEAIGQERLEEMRFEKERRRGLWITVEAARKEAFESERIVREAMLNITPRIAAELAAETDPQRLAARLEAEIRAALHAAADTLEQAS